MYWTDWEEDPKDSKRGKIEKAWMDGTHRTVFITSKTVLWPNGLSLDIPAKVLYWVDAFYDRIEMVTLDGTERKVSISSASASHTGAYSCPFLQLPTPASLSALPSDFIQGSSTCLPCVFLSCL